jgi:hypothetical protein
VGFPLRVVSQTPIRTSKQIGKLNPQSDWDSHRELGLEQGLKPYSANTLLPFHLLGNGTLI